MRVDDAHYSIHIDIGHSIRIQKNGISRPVVEFRPNTFTFAVYLTPQDNLARHGLFNVENLLVIVVKYCSAPLEIGSIVHKLQWPSSRTACVTLVPFSRRTIVGDERIEAPPDVLFANTGMALNVSGSNVSFGAIPKLSKSL